MNKISVVGGAGFVGTRFCRLLRDSQIPFEIVDLNTSQEFPDESIIADVRDVESLRGAIGGDIVVNLAAVHRDDVRDQSEYFNTNVTGAKNITAVCSEKGISKIVFTSSVAVYGFAEPGVGEDGVINPFNEYGKTKYEAEQVLEKWRSEADARSLIIVRPTVIFGEGNRGNVFNLLNQIAGGLFVMIGGGRNKKSMAYVGNVAAFLKDCAETDVQYGVYNYVDGPDFSMNDLVSKVRKELNGKEGTGLRLPYWLGLCLGKLADLVAAVIGRNLPISAIRIQKFCSDSAFSSRKSELDGFQPPYSLEQGLRSTLDSEFINPDPNRQIFFTE